MGLFLNHNRVLALFVGLWFGLSFGLMMLACDGSNDTEANGLMAEAEEALKVSDLKLAKQAYAEALHVAPWRRDAALGHGLVSLLLLPESNVGSQLLQELGADGPFAVSEVIFGPEGALRRLSHNITPAAVLQYLVSAGPWPISTWDSQHPLLCRLPADTSPAAVVKRLAALSPQLESIARDFGLASMGENQVLVIPGEAFFLDRSLAFSTLDAQIMQGLVRAINSSIWLLHAQDWPETPFSSICDSWVEQNPSSLSELYPDPEGLWADRLAFSQDELRAAIDLLIRALVEASHRIPEGKDIHGSGPVHPFCYECLTGENLLQMTQVMEALRLSINVPTLLPGSSPDTIMDLTWMFGRNRSSGALSFSSEDGTLEGEGIWWPISSVRELFLSFFEPIADDLTEILNRVVVGEDTLNEKVILLVAPMNELLHDSYGL